MCRECIWMGGSAVVCCCSRAFRATSVCQAEVLVLLIDLPFRRTSRSGMTHDNLWASVYVGASVWYTRLWPLHWWQTFIINLNIILSWLLAIILLLLKTLSKLVHQRNHGLKLMIDVLHVWKVKKYSFKNKQKSRLLTFLKLNVVLWRQSLS